MLPIIGATDPDFGGKACGLACARAAGLPVPAGWILPAPAPTPDRLDLPPGPYVVRSSATIEDQLGHAAPGIFRSLRDVAAEDVPVAIRSVRASLTEPTALAYLAHHRLTQVAMAVVIQTQVEGTRVTAYSRAPGEPERVLIEVGDRPELALIDRNERIDGRADTVGDDTLRAIGDLARRAEAALGAPADIELVAGTDLWVVQLRPIPAQPARPQAIDAAELDRAIAFTQTEPAAIWRWDASHNPAPLSPAQADLVAWVDEAQAGAVRQRVVLGYLYTTAYGAPGPLEIIPEQELAAQFEHALAPAFEQTLARMGRDLDETLDAYVDFYRLYARVLAPSLAAARSTVILPKAAAAIELSAAWDVAAPIYGRGAIPLRTLRDIDDAYFARAQAGVRRAIELRAVQLGLASDDAAFVPLTLLRQNRRLGDAAAQAARAKAEQHRLARFAPPLQIINGRALFRPPSAGLQGRGTGGRVRGRIQHLDPLAPQPMRDRVAVVATVIPPMAPLLDGAVAIVAEQGGLLGHGAALARELGIPCIVGVHGAVAALAEGDEVWIDADAGVVVRL